MLNSSEHASIIAQFEKDMKVRGGYATKEGKALWSRGAVYCHGETNNLFLAYRFGYAFGKALHQSVDGPEEPAIPDQSDMVCPSCGDPDCNRPFPHEAES